MKICERPQCDSETTNKHYCSAACVRADYGRRNTKYSKDSKYCLQCGSEIVWTKNTYRNKFCNQSCNATYQNLKGTRRNSTLQGKCYNCTNELKYKNKSGLCSACYKTCRTQLQIDAWLANSILMPHNKYGGVPAFIRYWMVDTLGEKCSVCGFKERHPRTGNIVVEIEHLDGDYKHNRPENLVFLCPNHHALTDTYRAGNMGRGREFRRKSYQAVLE